MNPSTRQDRETTMLSRFDVSFQASGEERTALS